MKSKLCIAAVSLLLATASGPAQSQATGGSGTNQATPIQQSPSGTAAGVRATPLPEREFVATARVANLYEIQTAELALSRAGDPALKEFARMVMADHKTALKELEAAAKEADVAFPTGSALDRTHATKLASLEARKDPEQFDQAYRTDQIPAHRQTLTMLETYQRVGAKESLRVWAAKTLPVVRKHLDMLNAMK